jgi:hypothetical protein
VEGGRGGVGVCKSEGVLQTMNALELWIIMNELDHNTTMNKLTEAGLISDHCQTPADVWSGDAEKARDWLAEMEEKL